eukprot:GGOE01001486.1.p1 GENE.GGOE01001486.1~~GGOE01001486.1.p1  ORF type:complete len:899 (-),score=261.13 GGOE01001486.1:257-2914(-)
MAHTGALFPKAEVEYAKSGRSRCTHKPCSEMIEKGELRVGTPVTMPGADTPSFKWRHICCFTARQIDNARSIDNIHGLDEMRPADRLLVKRMMGKELVGDLSLRQCDKGTSAGSPKPPPKKAPRLPKAKAATPSTHDDSEEDGSGEDDSFAPAVTWEVKLEGGFTPLDGAVMKKLEAAYQGDQETLDLKVGDWMYRFDLEAMTQTNVKSNRARPLRRILGPAPSSPKPSAPAMKPAAASPKPVHKDPALWEWKNDSGSFVEFDSSDAAVLEGAYQKVGAGTFKTDMRGQSYLFDFKDWQQLNIATSKKRAIRRRGGLKRPLEDSPASPTKAEAIASPKPRAPLVTSSPADDDDDDEEEEEEKKKPSLKAHAAPPLAKPTKVVAHEKSTGSGATSSKVIKKGRGVVDEYSGLVDLGHIYQKGEDVWMATLNQTNIGLNNNKFYILQLIEADKGGKWWLWTRWGRVGVVGQSKAEPFSNLGGAMAAFGKKFREKTSNSWDDREHFVKHPGKYHLMLMDYGDDDDRKPAKKAKAKGDMPASTLPPRIVSLIELISDTEMMSKAMQELDIDTKKMPLGKVQKKQIKSALEVVAKIADELLKATPSRSTLVDLSSQFYTIIPHDFGMSTPPVLDSLKDVKVKMELLDTLADLEVASRLLDSSGDQEENMVDATYKSLHAAMKPVDKGSDTWKTLCTGVANTHGPTHKAYRLEVMDILEIQREGELERFQDSIPNHELLWHGSRLSNMMGILLQGLRIAPPEAPMTGYMFGKGVYFADIVTKSANYCHASPTNDTGLVLLCEVALGHEHPLQKALHLAKPPSGCQSVKGMGKMAPSPSGDKLLHGATFHLGDPVPQKLPGPSELLYNEYVVYDVTQVRIRYVLKLKFHFTG